MRRIIVFLLVVTLCVYFITMQGSHVDAAGASLPTLKSEAINQFTGLFIKDVDFYKDVVKKFKDMGDHWADRAVGILVELKVIDGYPEDGTFRPENNITRAEFTKILVTSMKLDTKSGNSFSDTADHWSKDYVNTAVLNGIIKSSEFGSSFMPDANITRLEMAKMVVRAGDLGNEAENLKGQATKFNDDGLIGYNDKGFIKLASENKIINGYPDNSFQPNGYATRAEASQMIINLLEYVSKDKTSTPVPPSTPGHIPTPPPTPVPTPIPTPAPTSKAIKHVNITQEEAKQFPKLVELMKFDNCVSVAATGPDQARRLYQLSTGYQEVRNEKGQMGGIMSVDFYDNGWSYVVDLSRYSEKHLVQLQQVLQILLPERDDLRDGMYNAAVEYRGKPGVYQWQLTEDYRIMVKAYPIENDPFWGTEGAFNVWVSIYRR